MGHTVTLATLKSKQRVYLEDSEISDWTDEALTVFINDAILMFTEEVPFSRSEDVVVSGNEYTMPDNCTQIELIWGTFSAGVVEFIETGDLQLGVWTEGDEPAVIIPGFPDEGSYYLPQTPQGSTFKLIYWASIPGDLSANDDELDLGQRAWGEQAIRALAGYFAYFPKSAYRARLEQWADKQDQNVNNPLEQEAMRHLKEYNRIVATYVKSSVLSSR